MFGASLLRDRALFMRRFSLLACSAVAIWVLGTIGALAAVPAFPGAKGPGATATGGRGGDVYHVTNLQVDLGGTIPGSFQYGLSHAPAAGRTIVFDVGGTIYLAGQSANDTFRVGAGKITVAGQTAPGPGITIAGTGTKWTGDNVVLRNITVRPNVAPVTYDAFSLQLKNSVVDHVSASWFTDEGISETDAGFSTTVQYAYINEGLNNASHAFGSIIATEVDGANLSYDHNLYAHDTTRLPRLGSEIGLIGAVTNFSNNVIYNWINKAGYSGTDQPSSTNFISNYYIKGNNNGATLFSGGDADANPGFTKIYQDNKNKFDSNKNGVFDGVNVSQSAYEPGNATFFASPFAVARVAAPDSADVALQQVLNYGGANWQTRNPIEQRIVQSVRSGTGSIINDLTAGTQSIEWATVLSERPDANGNAPYSRPANYDTDRDGMPDTWERAMGLNPAVPENNGSVMNDGYTNLEAYINE